MNRRIGWAAAAASLLGAVSLCLSAAPTYRLRRRPAFRPGDTVTQVVSGTDRVASAGKDRKVFKDATYKLDCRIVQQVLEVGADGRVESFLATVVWAAQTGSSTVPRSAAYDKTVKLEAVSAVVRRRGRAFAADTLSLASPTMRKLTASQIGLVKRIFHERMQLAAFDEAAAGIVLPAPAVSVGQSWRPGPKALAEWVRQNRYARSAGARPLGAEFKLLAVSKGVATIAGSIRLAAKMGGMDVRTTLRMRCRVGARSGRWFSQLVDKAVDGKGKDLTVTARGTQQVTNVVTEGTGTPASRPAGLQELGWAAPGKDANSFRSPRLGISLNLPKAYARKKTPPGTGTAHFAAKSGRSVAVTVEDPGRPIDMDELTPRVLANVKATIKDYRLTEQRPLALPGNVPATVFVGTCFGGGSTLVTIVAIDGTRLVNVTVGGRTGGGGFLAEASKIARSLRVFEPDLTAEQ